MEKEELLENVGFEKMLDGKLIDGWGTNPPERSDEDEEDD